MTTTLPPDTPPMRWYDDPNWNALPVPAPVAPSTGTTARARARWAALAGAGITAVGCFMPWATVTSVLGQFSQDGMTGDGKVLIVLAGLVVALALVRAPRWLRWVRFALALVVAGDALNIVSKLSHVGAPVTVGAGLWVVLAGAVAMAIGSATEKAVKA